MISAVFVDRPRLAIVIAILMTLAGVLSLLRIPVAQFPDIVPPQVTVSTSYAGASAAVVEATVAQPLEAQIIGVDKMIYMKSSSGNDGSYSLTVSFELGTNPDIDTVNVNNRVQQALSKLPPEVQRYGLTVRKRSAAILEFLQFYSEGGKQDPLFISNYVTINVLDRLARTPGVGDALLFGRLDYSMRVWFDMNRLISLNLAPSDIIDAIRAQNVQAPVGRIGARPTSDATQFQLNVQTQGRLVTAEQFGHIVIRANPDGSVLRLADIARVELGAASMDTESRLNGDPAVSIGLYLAPGANAVQTSARVQAALDELGKRFPEGLKSRVFYDSSSFVAATIDEVEKTLAIAFALVVLVVFLFLGNIRATIIPMVAIPVSLIGTFAVLLAVGFSANTVSLLALVLGIGVVVDDAIVVVENAERVMAENPDMPPGEATKMAMRQITGPVIAISLVLLSVFVPVGFIPGVSGSLFRQFAVTISVAMLISAINALTLSPALCGVFLRHHGRPRGPLRWVLGGIDSVRNGYAAVVHRLLRVSILSVLLLVVAGVGIWLLAARTPTGFLPEEDQGAFFVAVQLPDGASVSRTRAVVQQIEGLIAPMPQVAGRAVDRRLLAARWRQRAERGVRRGAAEAVRRSHRGRRQRAGGDRPRVRRGAAGALGQRVSVQPAADHRPLDQRRLRIPVGEPGRPRSRRDGERDAGTARRGESGPAHDARVLHLHREQSVDLARHRPREGAGARPQHRRRVQRAAIDAGRVLRQRLQPVRPHLAGEHPGQRARSQRCLRDLPDLRAQPAGRDGAAALGRRSAHRARAAGDQPVQQLPRGHDQRRPAARRVVGRCAGRRWSRCRRRRCRPAMRSNGRAPRIRRRRLPGRPAPSCRCRCCSPTCSWWRCTRAG